MKCFKTTSISGTCKDTYILLTLGNISEHVRCGSLEHKVSSNIGMLCVNALNELQKKKNKLPVKQNDSWTLETAPTCEANSP